MTFREKQVLQPAQESAAVVQQRAPLPVVSWAIIAVSGLRFFFDLTALNREASLPWDLYGPEVSAGQWWRLLSYALEHAGWLHIIFNMSVVYTLGMPLERILGSWRFLIISLATCLGSAAVSLFFAFNVHMVGASGMILGWAGAMLPISTQTGRRQLGTWLVQVAIISFLPGVSWQGHLGGFLFGLPFGFALRRGLRVFSYVAPVLLICAAMIAIIAGHPNQLPF